MNGLYVPHPSELVVLPDSGFRDMGSVTDVDSKGRFWLPVQKCYTLYGIRGMFAGGTGSANLAIRMDNARARPDVTAYADGAAGSMITSTFDFPLFTLNGVGTDGKNINFRVWPQEYGAFTFWRNKQTQEYDHCVLEWTNPDSGSMFWAVEVLLWDTSAMPAGRA